MAHERATFEMQVNKLVETATYSKAMKADCAKWRKFLKSNNLALPNMYAAFNQKHPDVFDYFEFLKAINHGKLSITNHQKVKSFFDTIQSKITKRSK